MLRVLSRNLILWDSVRPTMAWVNEQIPTLVRQHVENSESQPSSSPDSEEAGEIDSHAIRQAYCNIINWMLFIYWNEICRFSISTCSRIVNSIC